MTYSKTFLKLYSLSWHWGTTFINICYSFVFVAHILQEEPGQKLEYLCCSYRATKYLQNRIISSNQLQIINKTEVTSILKQKCNKLKLIRKL